MNSNNFSTINENSIDFQSKRTLFFATYIPHQEWSFPDCILYYITKNPSNPKCYQKMIQSCKYFFIKNPIIILSGNDIELNENGLNLLINERNINLNNVRTTKIWIAEEFFIRNRNSFFVETFPSSIIPKIYQNDINELSLWNINISFNDLMFLAAASKKCEILLLYFVTVMHEDGTIILLEKLIESLPIIKKFEYSTGFNTPNIISANTVSELLKTPHFSNLDYFRLHNIPQDFDIDTFFSYMKNNKKTKFNLHFCDQISDEHQNRLQEIVNEIIAAAENRNYKPPFINFSGIDQSVYDTLRLLKYT